MNNLLTIISLLLTIFVKPVFAEEKFVFIDTISPYQNIMVGQTFPISVGISNVSPNTAYKYIFFGGPLEELHSVETVGQNGSLVNINNDPFEFGNLPVFTTDNSGNGYIENSYAFINSNQPTGRYYVYVQLVLPDNSTPSELFSDPYQIFVIENPNITLAISTPTQTPIPTQTPSPTSSPTPTPTPTNTPVSTPTPTRTPASTPIPTFAPLAPTLTPMPTINMKIFGVSTSTSSATPSSSIQPDLILTSLEEPILTEIETGEIQAKISKSIAVKKTKKIIYIILFSGVVFLITPLIFFKINKK